MRCLSSIPRDHTVVYVDSNSSDGSQQRAREWGALIVELDLSKHFTAARARNEGFAALVRASPLVDYVQFVDGDCALSPSWLSTARTFLDEHEDVAAVCGRRREVDPGASIYNTLCDLEWDTPIGEAEACGGDALMRVSVFSLVTGFRSELMAGEEPELCLRFRDAGWKIWRIDADMTHHDAAMTRFGQWWLRCVRGGFGYAQVSHMTRNESAPLYKRNVMRALAWAGILPLVIIVSAVASVNAAVALTGLYAVQIGRIAMRSSLAPRLAWASAFFTQLSKFPELQGVLRFFLSSRHSQVRSSIDYK
ncbi:hypothetical protein BH09PSE3_BH09PSE3_00140 [soil metagenome]